MSSAEIQREFVCHQCVNDDALAKVVGANATSKQCDYCELEDDTPIAAPIEDVAAHIRSCIETHWTDPVNELSYNKREGGYQGDTYYAWDILEWHDFSPQVDHLQQDIVGYLDDHDWCRINYGLMSTDERLSFGWDVFTKAVKHQRRYTFWSMGDPQADPYFPHPDDVPVGKMLELIERVIQENNLFKDLALDTELWRVRVHDSTKHLLEGSEFASPPIEYATQPNRMSPAGISMFYGAEDWQTACKEVIDPKRSTDHTVSGGAFNPAMPLTVLDLHDLPLVPSFWESGESEERQALIFLHRFVRELSEPIARDGRQHIDYVPTQVFSEYIRYQMKADKNKPIRGIAFPSSRNRQRCYVLFLEYHNCVGSPAVTRSMQALRFNDATLQSKPVADEVASW